MQNKLLFIILLAAGFSWNSFSSTGKHQQIKNESEETGKITVYVTSADRQYDLDKTSIGFSKKTGPSSSVITINPEKRYQEMEGFGAAVTGSTCYNLMQMDPAGRKKFLTETFSHEKGLGFSYIRISIGCSDFSLSEYTCCDEEGIENFSLQEEEIKYVIPIIKDILKINPSLKIMGSPWTSPRWMKVNNLTERQPYNSWTGGHLNPLYYGDYATYFVKWIQAFADHGIQITSITPQNEPLNHLNSASLVMFWDEQRNFIKVLGPKLRQAGLDTEIYVFDHNYNYDNMEEQFNYPIKIYADEEAKQYIKGAAYHNYGGNKNELLNIHNQAPQMDLVFTETSIGTWNKGKDLGIRLTDDMREVTLGTVNNWCKAVIVWNLMLDSNRGPNREHGCRTCYGAVDIDAGDYKTITRNSHYYIIGHMAAVVKPGAVRIGSKADTDEGITYSAFENTDGSYALVVQNDSEESKQIGIKEGSNNFEYALPAKSVASFRWQTITYE
jgi:glucosylceramidase